VLKIPRSFRITLLTGQKARADHAARLVPAKAWQTPRPGTGPKESGTTTLSEDADHYNTHRPHRTLSQRPPDGKIPVAPAEDNIGVRRRARLSGLIHEYSQVA
jgi:hypothetical protein